MLGKQILGNVVADRAGHAMHTALVSRILRDRTLWEETTVEEEEEAVAPLRTRSAAGSVNDHVGTAALGCPGERARRYWNSNLALPTGN